MRFLASLLRLTGGTFIALCIAWILAGVVLALIGGIGLLVGDQSTYEVVLLCVGVAMVVLSLQGVA